MPEFIDNCGKTVYSRHDRAVAYKIHSSYDYMCMTSQNQDS